MTTIRVVLFASGVGQDPTTYRPNADETQWWNRRDALVRCVTSYFFGCQRQNNNNNSHQKEMMMYFDQDGSTLHMTYNNNNNNNNNNINNNSSTAAAAQTQFVVPTEQNIIALWKRCAKCPNTIIHHGVISCQLIVLPSSEDSTRGSSSGSKRELIEYLQTTCSMEFLRQHRLNSTLETLLRKSNKSHLLQVRKEWERSHANTTTKDQNKSSSQIKKNHQQQQLEAIIARALQQQQQQHDGSTTFTTTTSSSSSNINPQVLAVTLHESSVNELPCWDDDDVGDSSAADHNNISDKNHRISTKKRKIDPYNDAASPRLICFFLGAVRDMTPEENECLHRVCQYGSSCKTQKPSTTTTTIPCIQVRLGPVAEFTSKILAVLAFHDAHDRLGPACIELLTLKQDRTQEQQQHSNESTIPTLPPTTTINNQRSSSSSAAVPQHHHHPVLHFVGWVPMSSTDVSVELDQRNTTVWCMVRCIVNSLWRSRLAGGGGSDSSLSSTTVIHGDDSSNHVSMATTSSKNNNIPINRLTLVFTNGICITLQQDDIVHSMAEQHQAAPSEYQILSVLRSKLDAAQSNTTKSTSGDSDSNTWTRIRVQLPGCDSTLPPNYIMDFDFWNTSKKSTTSGDSSQRFYSSLPRSPKQAAASASPLHVVVSFPLPMDTTAPSGPTTKLGGLWKKAQDYHQAWIEQSRQKRIPIIDGCTIVNTGCCCIDQVGATITMIQHLCYQGRLIPLLSSSSSLSMPQQYQQERLDATSTTESHNNVHATTTTTKSVQRSHKKRQTTSYKPQSINPPKG